MNTKTFITWCLALLAVGITALSCKNKTEEGKAGEHSLLMVERQQVELKVDEESYPLSFTVDVPVSGPQVLTDSLKAFLNEQLYEFMEMEVEEYDEGGAAAKTKKFDEVRTDDTRHLLRHYVDTYAPSMKKTVMWSFVFSIILIAQTDNYVTYGLTNYRCGASCGSEMMCFTFSKKDGHRLRGVISQDDLKKFFADKKKNDDEDWGAYWDDDCIALLEDHFLFAVNGRGNHYTWDVFDYKEVLPYLSKEAQTFVNERGDKAHCPWNEWFVGRQLGKIVSDGGDTIYVMERAYDDSMIEDFKPDFQYSNGAELLTFMIKNGQYNPYEGIKSGEKSMSALEVEFPDGAMYLPSDDSFSSEEGKGEYYSFDKDKRELHVRYLTGGSFKGTFESALRIYRFDGKQFVDTGKDL